MVFYFVKNFALPELCFIVPIICKIFLITENCGTKKGGDNNLNKSRSNFALIKVRALL